MKRTCWNAIVMLAVAMTLACFYTRASLAQSLQYVEVGSCISFSPLPSVPKSPNYPLTIPAFADLGYLEYSIVLWRETCASDANRSLLLIRITPKTSAFQFRGFSPKITQNGRDFLLGDIYIFDQIPSSGRVVGSNTPAIISIQQTAGTYVLSSPFFENAALQQAYFDPNQAFVFEANTQEPASILQRVNVPARGASPVPIAQTISFPPLSNRTLGSGTFALSATATSGLQVTFSSLTPTVCSVSATTVTLISAGNCTIAANQSGNSTYSAGQQVTQSFLVTSSSLQPQTINFPALVNRELGSGNFSITASATSGLAVTFTSITQSVCTVANGTVTLLSVGTCSISANQAGNATFSPASQVTQSFSVTGQVVAFTENFDGTSLRSNYWTAIGPGTVAVSSGLANFSCSSTASTSGKFVVSGAPIVIESRFAGTGSLRDTVIYLVDVTNPANVIQVGDTNYQGKGLYSLGSGVFNLPQIGNGASTSGFKEYRLTLSGTSLLFQRGDTLANLTETTSATLPTSIAGKSFYLGIGTGGPDYCPGTFDWITVSSSEATPRNYSDMWWAGSAENGWGMSIQQHGNVQFNALYVYDSFGKPVWYVMPGGTWSNNFTVYSGLIYQPSSAPLSAYSPAQFVVGPSPGSVSITFSSSSTAVLQYTINGVSGQKSIQRQEFGSGTAPLSVGDMWWGGTAQDGWGLSIVQRSGILFGAWYTYGADGKVSWYVLPSGTWSGTSYSGPFYSTTGSGWLGVSYNPNQLSVTQAGTMTLNFSNSNNAVMTYTFTSGPFAGTSQSKSLTRMSY